VLSAIPVGGQFLVNESFAAPEPATAVAILDSTPGSGGEFVAVWQSYGEDGDGWGVFAQVFDRDGEAIPGQPAFQVNQPAASDPTGIALGNQLAPTVASDGSGGFLIAWQGEDLSAGGYDIYARRASFLGGTLVLEDQQLANTDLTAGNQVAPTAAMDAAGDFVVAWQSDTADPLSGIDIVARRGSLGDGFSADEFVVNDETSGDQTTPAASMNPATGDFAIAWRGPDTMMSIFAPLSEGGEDGEEETSEETRPGVFVNVFRVTGPALDSTGDIRVNASSYNDLALPAAAMNASGELVVAWQVEGQEGSGSDIYGRRFAFTGASMTLSPLATADAGSGDFRLNETTERPQRAPAVGIDADGDFLAAWQTQEQDGFSWAVFGRRYDAAGPTGSFGSEFLINTGTTLGPQIAPAVAVDGSGRSVVAWVGPEIPDTGEEAEEGEGGRRPSVRGKVFDNAGGVAVTDELLLAVIAGLESEPAATASDAAGNFVVVWQSFEDEGDESDFGIYVRFFQANGDPIDLDEDGLDGDRLLVNTLTAGSQSAPAVAMDSAGNFVVVWQAALADGDGSGIYARRWNASLKDWSDPVEFLVNETSLGDQITPAVAMDGSGRFTVVWAGPDSDGTGIFARRYAADGTPDPAGEFQVNVERATDQSSPTIGMNEAGDAVIAWVSDHNRLIDPEDAEKTIFARWYDFAGTPLGAGEFSVSEYVKDAQEFPTVGLEGDGDFTLAWQSINQESNQEGEGTSWGVYARQFTVDRQAGTISSPQAAEFRVNETTDGPQRYPAIGVAAEGQFVVTWQSIRQDESSWGIFERQFAPDASPTTAEARVNSFGSGPQILPAVAQRPSGNFTIIWSGRGFDETEGVWGQRYDWIADAFEGGAVLAAATSPALGPNWTEQTGGYAITPNSATATASPSVASFNGISLRDVSVEGEVSLANGGGYQGFMARYSGPADSNMYWGGLVNRGSFLAEIWRNSGGTWTLLAREGVAGGSGSLQFDVIGESLKLSLDGVVVAFANDAVITQAGGIGMRGSLGTSVDNFSYARLQQTVAGPLFRDFFNLSDGSPPNRFWISDFGNFVIEADRLVGQGRINNTSLGTAPATDGTVTATVRADAVGKFAGIMARSTGRNDADMYWAGLVNRTGSLSSEVWRNLGGSWTLLEAETHAGLDPAAEQAIAFDIVAAELVFTVNGTTAHDLTDAAIPGPGRFGLRASAAATISQVEIDDPIVTASLPFSTAFNPTPTGDLGPEWTVELGSYSTATGSALATATPSIATLNGVLAANATFQATILIPGPGRYAGFVARSTGLGETDMLWAGLVNRGGPLQAEIWRNVAGSWSLLSAAAVPGPATAPRSLLFTAVNSSLDLRVDGLPVTSASDTVLGIGRVGMRASAGTLLDNLSIS